MVKPLSEQLADLSAHAKNTEDGLSAAQTEAHDKVLARRQQAHAAATAATEKVSTQIKSVNDTAARNLGGARAKIAADMAALKAGIAGKKHEHDLHRAEKHADDLEGDAAFSIDFAISSIELAKVAVLDAIDARLAAEETKGAA